MLAAHAVHVDNLPCALLRRDGQVTAWRSAGTASARPILPRAPLPPIRETVRTVAGQMQRSHCDTSISLARFRAEASSSGGESEFEDAVESQEQLRPDGSAGSPTVGDFDHGDDAFGELDAGAEKEAEETVPLVRGLATLRRSPLARTHRSTPLAPARPVSCDSSRVVSRAGKGLARGGGGQGGRQRVRGLPPSRLGPCATQPQLTVVTTSLVHVLPQGVRRWASRGGRRLVRQGYRAVPRRGGAPLQPRASAARGARLLIPTPPFRWGQGRAGL